MKQKVAFFDIDGTIFRSSLLIELVETCIQKGVFPKEVNKIYKKEYKAWLNREGTYEDYIDVVVKAFIKHIKGVYYGDFAEIGKIVVERQGKHIYRYTRNLVIDLQNKNYYIVAISQSPKMVLDKFCKTLGFDKVYGRIYSLDKEDCFTGEVGHLEMIQDKSRIVESVFEKNNFDYKNSVGVGDTEGDISLLQSVHKPICFNPNMLLYKHARTAKWPVVIERKDVIYTL